jgi:hypothetical protein
MKEQLISMVARKTVNYDKILWARVNKTADGCWLWTGSTNDNGYGKITIHHPVKKTLSVHRLVYSLLVGPVPPGSELDHVCKTRTCCNPAHLEPVSHRENVLRTDAAHKTHCKHGHEFTPENTLLNPRGHRLCRACAKLRNQAYHKRKAAQRPILEKTVCPQGHDYQSNRVVYNGTSYCRICLQEKSRRVHRTKAGIPLDAPLQRRNPAEDVCIRGHMLTPENTYIRPSGGAPSCRTCKREQLRDWRQRRSI